MTCFHYDIFIDLITCWVYELLHYKVIPIYTYFIWILIGLSLVPTLELVSMVSYLLQNSQYNFMNKVFNCVLWHNLQLLLKTFSSTGVGILFWAMDILFFLMPCIVFFPIIPNRHPPNTLWVSWENNFRKIKIVDIYVMWHAQLQALLELTSPPPRVGPYSSNACGLRHYPYTFYPWDIILNAWISIIKCKSPIIWYHNGNVVYCDSYCFSFVMGIFDWPIIKNFNQALNN